MILNIRIIISLFVLTFLFSSCQSDSGKKTESNSEVLKGDVKIDGSSTVYPITEAIAEEFLQEQRKVKVTIGFSGTGGGFKKFGRGEIDINNASRSIKEKEAKACEEANLKFIELKIAFDGLAIVVNPENTWVNDITPAELKKMWEPSAQDNIKKWSQIRAGWPDEEFHLYGAGTASGTYDYFTEAIVGESGASRGDYTASEDDNVLVQGVAGDKNGIAFFGIAYYTENKSKLKLVPVNNGKGAVTPNEKTIMDGTYAPLSRPLFIYVNDASAQRPEVKAFINFYLKNSSVLVKDVGYVPLPDADYQKEIAKFESFVAGLAK